MSSHDDRASFEEKKRAQAIAMGRDERLFAAATDLLTAADKYDYAYLWSWLGVPIIQLPADVMATQEVIWATKPDVIIETGVARGGSVLFMASLLELIGKGKVIGVDIDIRAHNRDSIERHPMSKRVVLIEGPSTDPAVIAQVRRRNSGERVGDGGSQFRSQPHARARRATKLWAPGDSPAAISWWRTPGSATSKNRKRRKNDQKSGSRETSR